MPNITIKSKFIPAVKPNTKLIIIVFWLLELFSKLISDTPKSVSLIFDISSQCSF